MYISLDREMKMLGHLTSTTGADAMRQVTGNSGLDGTGIGIAVLDSSVFHSHDSFLGKDGNKRLVFDKDFTGEGMNTDDPYGHGSHVAGLAAGNGLISDGAYTGIAPNAKLINLRVLNSQGVGTVSGLLQALDWVMINRTTYNIRVVNMSLGTLAVDSYKNDPLCKAVRKLVDAGVVVVAASGNNGKNSAGQKIYGQIHSPGNEPSAITVGASNTFNTDSRADDAVTSYSSRGPTRSFWTDAVGFKHYDNVIKPDLVAPGNKLIAPQSESNYLVTTNPELDANISSSGNDDRKMMYLSGTSMAAPVVAGAAALMLQANPKLTPNMVKMILQYTAQPLKGSNMFEQGAGQLNIEGAIRLARLVRTDLTNSTAVGASMLTTTTLPTAQTTIANHTFSWARGIVAGHTWVRGQNLIEKYQRIYNTGVLIGDGVLIGNGLVGVNNILIRNQPLVSDGVLIGDQIMTSDGVLIGDGVSFVSILGVLIGNGVLIGDGGLMNSTMLQAQSALINGYASFLWRLVSNR